MTEPTLRPATQADVAFLTHLMWLGYQADHPDALDDAPAAWIDGARADTCELVPGHRGKGIGTTIILDVRLRPGRQPSRSS
jgi:hypothetical protein